MISKWRGGKKARGQEGEVARRQLPFSRFAILPPFRLSVFPFFCFAVLPFIHSKKLETLRI